MSDIRDYPNLLLDQFLKSIKDGKYVLKTARSPLTILAYLLEEH